MKETNIVISDINDIKMVLDAIVTVEYEYYDGYGSTELYDDEIDAFKEKVLKELDSTDKYPRVLVYDTIAKKFRWDRNSAMDREGWTITVAEGFDLTEQNTKISNMLPLVLGFANMYKRYELTDRECTLIASILDNMNDEKAWLILSSCYNEKFCDEMKEYIDIGLKLPDFNHILEGYFSDKDYSLSEKYAIISTLTQRIKESYDADDGTFYPKFDTFINYAMSKLSPEFAIMGIKNVIDYCSHIKYDKLTHWYKVKEMAIKLLVS